MLKYTPMTQRHRHFEQDDAKEPNLLREQFP